MVTIGVRVIIIVLIILIYLQQNNSINIVYSNNSWKNFSITIVIIATLVTMV